MKTEQELKDIFGKNIKTLRIRKKWSQEKLAESIGVSRNTISEFETGQNFAHAPTLVNLAIALETEVYELLKPEGVLPDKPVNILAEFSEEVKQKMDEIEIFYIERMKNEVNSGKMP